MGGSSRKEIDNTEARLARRKRAVVLRSARLGKGLHEKLTEPAAFIIAGTVGYLIGEFTQTRKVNEQSPESRPPPDSIFDDITFWVKTGVTLINWSQAISPGPADSGRSSEKE